ncbi:fibronectin-binding protein A N-terminus-domain-containing protein [Clohesyomyces aquaticus]|uniref:Ribosome quality control complex subunit 2 n=1 Tax=Clohesyomyces aquaticus TaxID=1231657 RepID=A0A1Y1Z233_9PLEO|nr:fibronectin-binding protein A N-terminus-domain-containing protein [Clohesyomyces aquaticus]
MKQRFSSLDVKAIAHELSNTLCPLRVNNIYDLSSRIFLIKFHKADQKEQLIIESGFRCHLTNYARTTAAAPSTFVARLRKCLKTRRVTAISQVGTDRIIEFQFSDGLYRLYLEFYAGGNIVLTDGDLKVLGLLRNVDEGAEHERLRVGLQYNLSSRQNYGGAPELTKERVREALQKAIDRQQEPVSSDKKAKKKSKDALRKALAVSISECPPLLVDHAMHVAEFDSALKPQEVLDNDSLLESLLAALQDARKTSEAITAADPIKGYILAKPNPAVKKEEEGEDGAPEKSRLLYDDFHPFRPQQFEKSDYTFLEFDGFNKAVDEYFSSIEGQQLESKLTERELAAKKKLDKARNEHANRIDGLDHVQQLNFKKAEALSANVHRVTEAITAVNGLIGQGMDWGEIARLIEREQSQGNVVAQLIRLPLKLYENTITLLLSQSNLEQENEDDGGYETSSVSGDSEDEDSKTPAAPKAQSSQLPALTNLAIDVDLGLSAWANATEYFDQRRSAADKKERTVQASTKALQSHERKVAEDLKKGLKQEKEVLRPVRRQQWFEKYIYFISSDGYLVLGGKDAQQNEILYRRYLRKGDVYVHADLKGAVPLIIKNRPNTPEAPIPPSTLSQAGHLSVSTSEAWDSKAVMSAWWVNGDQVGKTAPTGEYLAPGLFHIKGKKEFLPPAQLILGLAVIFEISEESKARHLKHRVVDQPVADTSMQQDDVVDEQKALEADKQEAGEESNSDEDFPDAKIGSDSDEDFPDAKLDSDDSDAESRNGDQTNPLQSRGTASKDDEGGESGSEEEPGKPENKEASQKTTESSKDETPDDAGSIPDSERPQGKSKSGIRHLSARERRLLRKGQPLDTAPGSSQAPSVSGTAVDEDDASEADIAITATKGPATVTSQASKAGGKGPLPRGKRSKAKKLAAKYAAQDEEERELAMRLLGSKSGQQAAEVAAQAKRAKEEEEFANKQRRREQHLKAQAAGKAAEDARKAALEGVAQEDDGVDDEATNAQIQALDALTGRPLPSDEILSATPVCAPWSALATYKYKVKLQPGTLKRGKAVKDILAGWDAAGKNPKALDKLSQDAERIWPKEIDLIRGWKEPEVVGVLPVGKVRIMRAFASGGGGGGAKGKTKSARGGRGSKKQK